MESTSSEAGLCEEVFNILPGTMNHHRGAAQYHSQDQPFSFQKQVRFEDNTSSPDLKASAGLKKSSSQPPMTGTLPNLPDLSSHPRTSTLFSGTRILPQNRTFDISQIAPLTGNPQDAVTIVAKISATAAVQASMDFHCMCEPKIAKFKGEYSADAELAYHLWCTDILAHITDCELDNKVVIQLIKDHKLDSACHKVKFQLDLCGGEIEFQDMLKHLSIAFQGGDNEANILAEFYSHLQHAKESEEAFADERQLLARKVISKKPDF